jgi:hypothetical protein
MNTNTCICSLKISNDKIEQDNKFIEKNNVIEVNNLNNMDEYQKKFIESDSRRSQVNRHQGGLFRRSLRHLCRADGW